MSLNISRGGVLALGNLAVPNLLSDSLTVTHIKLASKIHGYVCPDEECVRDRKGGDLVEKWCCIHAHTPGDGCCPYLVFGEMTLI